MTENTPDSSGGRPQEPNEPADNASNREGTPEQGPAGVPVDPESGPQPAGSDQDTAATGAAESGEYAQDVRGDRGGGQYPSGHAYPGTAQYPHPAAGQYPGAQSQPGQSQPYPGTQPYTQQYPQAANQPQYQPYPQTGQPQTGQPQPEQAQGQQPYGQPYQHGPYRYGSPFPQEGSTHVSGGSRSGGKGRYVVGALALVLVVGLISGGVGGVVGYRLSDGNSSAVTALDQPKPAGESGNAQPGSVQAVADHVLPSVVQIQVRTPRGTGSGSGIVLSKDGYILTNNHVVQGGEASRIMARFNAGKVAPLEVVGTAPWADLAVLKADVTGLNPAELGNSKALQVGSPVVAVGSPFGLSGTVTSGIISAKNRPVRAGGESGSQSTVLNALQTDAAINPGNSGGPLVDMQGRVVGINSAIYSPSSVGTKSGSVGLGFAIPIDNARRIAKELIDTGSATKTTLGVRITSAPKTPGALVVRSMPDSPAQRAGIRAGDVITKVNDRVVTDADELIAAVRSHAPGERVTLTMTDQNGNNTRTTKATLAGKKQ